METHAMDGAFISQLTSAALVVYLLQFLKKTGWYARFARWLPMDDAHVHRAVSVLGAFASSIGVHVAFTGSAGAGWHFSGTIPPLAVLLHSVWDLGQQFALNQLTYDAVAQRAGSSSTIEQRVVAAVKSASSQVVVLTLAVALGAGALGCASTTPVTRVTIVETAAVQAVHATVQAEASAYVAGAYDRATHERYLRALQNTVRAEKALNDALLGWAHTQEQPMPAAVAATVRSLASVLKDLQPLIPTNSAAATLAASLVETISLLTGA